MKILICIAVIVMVAVVFIPVSLLCDWITYKTMRYNPERCKPCKLWDCERYKDCPLSSYNCKEFNRKVSD